MGSKSIEIIKIGGAVITDKKRYKTLKEKNLVRIAEEIAGAPKRPRIIIHGAGSFGHIIAKKFEIVHGYRNTQQMQGVLTIRKDMQELSNIIVNTLNNKEMNALSFQTSAITYIEEKGEAKIFVDPIKKALELGFIPVLSGDIIFNEKEGFSIISGDQLIELLTGFFEVKKVIFCSDVDGLFVYNKAQEPILKEKLVTQELENIELAKLNEEGRVDVTGEMSNKMKVIKTISQKVHEIIIVNGTKEGRLYSVLTNKKTVCTQIRKEKE